MARLAPQQVPHSSPPVGISKTLTLRHLFAPGILLNLSFYFLTLADAFTVFVAVGTLGTVFFGRVALGTSERLSLPEIAAGAVALAGVALIARPTALFGSEASRDAGPAPRASLLGLAICAMGGVASAGFNLFT